MSEKELLRLWEQARTMAHECCARSYARLRAGQGGFYSAEDFEQDLFLEFWRIVQRWQESRRAQDKGALWAAWSGAMSRQGWRVLRRAPQRLWHGRQEPLPPTRMENEEPDSEAGWALSPRARYPLTQLEDAERTRAALEYLDRLESALRSLRPSQRQLLYLMALEELSADSVSLCLGLNGPDSVYRRLHRARALLNRRLKRQRKER